MKTETTINGMTPTQFAQQQSDAYVSASNKRFIKGIGLGILMGAAGAFIFMGIINKK